MMFLFHHSKQVMENISKDFNASATYREEVWIADVAITTAMTLVSIYIAVALLYHEIYIENRSKVGFSMLVTERKTAIISKYICIVIALVSIINQLSSVGILWIEMMVTRHNITENQKEQIDSACQILPKLENTAAVLGTGFVYLFLWFRQRILYVHPCMTDVNNIVVKIINFFLIFIWVIYFISSLACYCIFIEYELVYDSGCFLIESDVSIYFVMVVTWVALSVFLQIVLLGLFIFPIVKKSSWLSRNMIGESLLHRAKKAVVLTAICLGSDLLSAVLVAVLNNHYVDTAFFIYNLNLLVNYFVTIACFDHWKSLLWPWTKSKSSSARLSLQSTKTMIELR